MIYRKFKDISISRLGMGNMRLPLKEGGTAKDIDYDKAQEIIDYAMANGINYYDTAYVYHSGMSEVFLGKALKKYDRSSFYVASKFHSSANPDYKAVFAEQLKRLDMDYIDFYLIHCITDGTVQDYLTSGCIDYFLEQKRLGKIKYLGFSSHGSTKTLELFANHHDWDFAQIQLNYFDYVTSTSKIEYDILAKRNIPIIVMEPVRGGKLATLNEAASAKLKESHPDWSIPSWAFRWIKGMPEVLVTLSGMSTLDQIVDNVKTFSDEYALSDDEVKTLFEAEKIFEDSFKVPCTECRYCCDDCPMNINIPEVLKVYNSYKLKGKSELMKLKGINSEGKVEDCIGCGTCKGLCPQNIDIPAVMEEIQNVLKTFKK